MRSGTLPKTSSINVMRYYDFFKDLLKSGKDVIYMDMSKEISGAYNNSLIAKEMIQNEFPDQRLTIIDTGSIAIGLGLLIKECVALKESGADYDEVVMYADEIKGKIAHCFMVENLRWLQAGGRISNASAVVGTLMAIKPLIYVDEEGKLIASRKVHGRKKAVHALIASIKENTSSTEGLKVLIAHADCGADAEQMKQAIRETYPDIGEITIYELGPTIGCHVGPDFLACAYIANGRKPL